MDAAPGLCFAAQAGHSASGGRKPGVTCLRHDEPGVPGRREEVMTDVKWKFDTAVIHGAQAPGERKSATLAPIYQTASHRFATAEEPSDVFAGKKAGFIYQRLRNPTNEVLEKRR